MRYVGKEPCQGCNVSGIEKSRIEKNKLCDDCRNELQHGRIKKSEENFKYSLVFQHYYAYRWEWLNTLCQEILKSVHNPNANAGGVNYISPSTGSNGNWYKIPEYLLKPIENVFKALEAKATELENGLSDLPKTVRLATEDKKNEIYNEGIQYGRNLLIQLNAGEITLSQLDKTFNYNS